MTSPIIRAYLGLGGNLGNPVDTIRQALGLLDAHSTIRVIQTASLYSTEPVGFFTESASPPPWFINTAAAIDTTLSAPALLRVVLALEQQRGRTRPVTPSGYLSRTLDIDLLLYGDLTLRESDLEIPHPRLHERAFVLAPLLELAPEYVHPCLNRTIRELYQSLGTLQRIKQLAPDSSSTSKISVSASLPRRRTRPKGRA